MIIGKTTNRKTLIMSTALLLLAVIGGILFVLVGSEDERRFHLQALAAIAQVVQRPGFEADWLAASDGEALRALVQDAERRRDEAAEVHARNLIAESAYESAVAEAGILAAAGLAALAVFAVAWRRGPSAEPITNAPGGSGMQSVSRTSIASIRACGWSSRPTFDETASPTWAAEFAGSSKG